MKHKKEFEKRPFQSVDNTRKTIFNAKAKDLKRLLDLCNAFKDINDIVFEGSVIEKGDIEERYGRIFDVLTEFGQKWGE